MAPGVEIRSTVPKNSYEIWSGTSFSSPWTAGVIALMMAKHRTIGGKTPLNTVEDIREHLKKSAIDLNQAGRDNLTGYGLVNVAKAIEQIKGESIKMDELIVKFNAWIEQIKDKKNQIEDIKQQIADLENQLKTDDEKIQKISDILT